MKYFNILFLLCFGMLFSANAQRVNDSAVYGPGYANMVYYQLSDGSRTSIPVSGWDFQIYTDLFEEAIRINGGGGAELYAPVNNDTSDWASLDTTGMMALYNSDTSWIEGAFEGTATGHPDYGWGTYTAMGNLTGKEIFVLKTHDGLWKKVWIKELGGFGQVYTIEIADLSGANSQTITINKSGYGSKQFFFYGITQDTILDWEPAKAAWDLVFRRYVATVGPGVHYPVTGVLHNIGVSVAEATGVDPETVTDNGLPYSTEINTIGFDWKDQMLNLDTNRAYFVRDLDGDIWKLVFTDFESGFSPPQTGTAFFWKELVAPATGIENPNGAISEFSLYPNPATDVTNLIFHSKAGSQSSLQVMDLSGKIVKSFEVEVQEGLNNYRINTNNLPAGNYFVTVSNNVETVRKQLLIVR